MPDSPSCARSAILDAFIALALERRYATIRVIDLTARAGVGKSTFYDHFRGKDDVLLSAMQPVLLALSTAASGRAARTHVRAMVDHLWQRRSAIRPILDSSAGPVLHRHLADMVAAHGAHTGHASGTPLFATGIAAAQLAMVRSWLAGHVVATIDAMTDQLMACSALRIPTPPPPDAPAVLAGRQPSSM